MEMMGIFTKPVLRCFANGAKDSQSCRFCREFPNEPEKDRGHSPMQEMAQNSNFASFPSRLCSTRPPMAPWQIGIWQFVGAAALASPFGRGA